MWVGDEGVPCFLSIFSAVRMVGLCLGLCSGRLLICAANAKLYLRRVRVERCAPYLLVFVKLQCIALNPSRPLWCPGAVVFPSLELLCATALA